MLTCSGAASENCRAVDWEVEGIIADVILFISPGENSARCPHKSSRGGFLEAYRRVRCFWYSGFWVHSLGPLVML